MSRLTEFRDGIWGLSVDAVREGYDRYSVFSRLAAYEDIGLEPKQVRKIANVLQEIGQEYNCRFEFVAEVVEKYAKYVEAERDGRLEVLPCKVGDTVYVLHDKKILHQKVWRVIVCHANDDIFAELSFNTGATEQCKYSGGFKFYFDDIGKTIFLTRAEAENAITND